MRGTCDSCGRSDEDVAPVHRVYVVPEQWDTQGSSARLTEVEQWCFPCRTTYPHEPATSESEQPGQPSRAD